MAAPRKPLLLALLASPRARGACASLLAAYTHAAAGWRIRRITLDRLSIAPYREPSRQNPEPEDDMRKLIRLFDRADALVLAAPVYFYGLPAQAKAMVDRCQPLWLDPAWRKRPKRPGCFLSTCASGDVKMFEIIQREARAFFNTIGFTCAEELLLPGMDLPQARRRLNSALPKARRLARQLPVPCGTESRRHG